MSGYARRPGAPPLSRTRSLVVPDGEQHATGARPGRGARAEATRGEAALVVAYSSCVL